jgi:hypothetical protein
MQAIQAHRSAVAARPPPTPAPLARACTARHRPHRPLPSTAAPLLLPARLHLPGRCAAGSAAMGAKEEEMQREHGQDSGSGSDAEEGAIAVGKQQRKEAKAAEKAAKKALKAEMKKGGGDDTGSGSSDEDAPLDMDKKQRKEAKRAEKEAKQRAKLEARGEKAAPAPAPAPAGAHADDSSCSDSSDSSDSSDEEECTGGEADAKALVAQGRALLERGRALQAQLQQMGGVAPAEQEDESSGSDSSESGSDSSGSDSDAEEPEMGGEAM